MTTYLFIAMFAVNASIVLPYVSGARQVITIIFLVTFVIPVLSISFLKLTKSISSFKLEIRKERIMPFSFIAIFYGVATWMFFAKQNLAGINTILLIITLMILVLTLITIFWKISAHAMGVGGVLGFFTNFYINDPQPHILNTIAVIVIIAGLVMSSRLKLNVHTPAQLYSGLILSFILSFVSLLMLS